MKTPSGFCRCVSWLVNSGWRHRFPSLLVVLLGGLLSPVRAADSLPPAITFGPLVDGQVVADLAGLGGAVSDDSDPAPAVTVSIREVAHNAGAGRWWNGSAWQTEAIKLPAAVTGTAWQKPAALNLPPLNSGLRFELSAIAIDSAGNASSPAVITVQAARRTLTWDPGTTHDGTEVLTQPHRLGGSHLFKIVTQNTAVGAWRTALKVSGGEADVYLNQGNPPTVGAAAFGSARVGADGFVVADYQFTENQEWFVLVESQPGATWSLVTGEAFVLNLGALPGATATGDTEVSVGPEGSRFFRTVAPADTLAWRLWLHGFEGTLYVRKGFAPSPQTVELKQAGAMLVVPDYLQADTTYFVGVPANPGATFTFHSKQQPVTPVAFSSTQTGVGVTGFPYTTYRVEVPLEQIAWEVRTIPTGGNPNLALRRGFVPNEFNNDAFSEVPGAVEDSVTLVPPTLSDGTFYITTYGDAPRAFALHNGEPVITPRAYSAITVNDDPNRAGWRYYVVDDIPGQLGTLGWDLVLSGQKPGTEIALRRNAVPGRWRARDNGNETFVQPFVDFFDTRGFLQRPGHQADIWYVGIYQPDTSLGAFTLKTSALAPTPVDFDGSTSLVTDLLPGRWRFFRIDVPEDARGWDVRLANVTTGQPRLTVRRDLLPDGFGGEIPPTGKDWPTGVNWSATGDWTGLYRNADGSDPFGRIVAVGRDNPLKPGTYYVGVLDVSAAVPSNFRLASRGIGPGLAIPVTDLDFSGPGGRVANTAGLAPREAAYYRVMVPANQTSWKVRLTPTTGDALLLVEEEDVPDISTGVFSSLEGGGRKLLKAGPEHYLLLPRDNAEFLRPGPYHLAVVSEGVGQNRPEGIIGTGVTTYVLESLGAAPAAAVGGGTALPVGAAAITQPVAVAGGEVKLFQFTVPAGLPAIEVRLQNRTGNPSVTVRAGTPPSLPHVPCCRSGDDLYGADGGSFVLRHADLRIATIANPLPGTYSVTVKAEDIESGAYPDATADLTVEAVAPAALAFDGGGAGVVGQEPGSWRFFTVNVPSDPGVLGWDLRVTAETGGGSPQVYIRRGALPDLWQGSLNLNGREWPEGAQFQAEYDWTSIYENVDGRVSHGRVFAAGVGNPLVPGTYRVGVLNRDVGFATSYTLLSRGIGAGQTLAVNDLDFAGGQFEVPALAPREAAYYRIVVPPNTPSWKLRLAPTTGEALLLVQAGLVPNVALQTFGGIHTGNGTRQRKEGNEHFSIFPAEGQDFVPAGVNYVAVVSEGAGGQFNSKIGTSPVAFRLDSVGPSPVVDLGEVPAPGAGLLTRSVALEGGEVRVFRFRVPVAAASLEVQLNNRVGAPSLALRPGLHEPYPQQPAQEQYGTEGGWSSQRQEASGLNPATLITLANPPVGDYKLTVRCGYDSDANGYADAAADLTVRTVGAAPLTFDGGGANISSQVPGTWRFFAVDVPPDATGWDLRLNGLTGGQALLHVRRDALPDFGAPGLSLAADDWPSGSQLNPYRDFTGLDDSDPATDDITGRSVIVGRGGPLVAGRYFVGVFVPEFEPAPVNYTLLSRGIGGAYSIPVAPLAFAGGNAPHLGLAPREVAWYSVEVPSGAPSWQVKLDASQGGEALLVLRKGRLPNMAADDYRNHVDGNGRLMSKSGNEHYLLLPDEGQSGLVGGTYFLGVVSAGVGPIGGIIGTGLSRFTLNSVGPAPVAALGTVPAIGGRLARDLSLEGGQTALFQFEVPPAVQWAEVRLASRLGAAALALRPGEAMPDPSVPQRPFGFGYGADGGWSSLRRHDPFLLTLVRPGDGVWSLAVKAEFSNSTDQPDATAQLQVEQLTPASLDFAGGSSGAILADNQRIFYRVEVPAGALGWKLDLDIANGTPTVRARKGVLPSDEEPGFVAFGGPSIVIAPPVLQPGTWFVEVKGAGASDFVLHSGPVELLRPAWVMPAFGGPVTTPGLPAGGIHFADTGVNAAGAPLPGDQGTDLGNGDFHYYKFTVPPGNGGLLRGELFAISGNPDAYVRAGEVPTLAHGEFNMGQLFDFSLTGTGSEYGNWVPLNGRVETELEPGPWYVAVRANASNIRYRLRLSVGSVTVLAPGITLGGQSIAAGDWRYYRVAVPADAPQSATLVWSAQQGDADLFVRDTVPPGEPIVPFYGYRDWGYDRKNAGPYPIFNDQGSFPVAVPPLRPGSVHYLGFRAGNDSTFTVRVDFSPAAIDVPHVVKFYGGTTTVMVPAGGRVNFRVPVPADATSWRHRNTHDAAVSVYLDQGTLPDFTPGRGGFIYSRTDNSDDTLVQFLNGWPWIAGADYFFTAVNSGATPQPFTIQMDGRNAASDDNDLDGLPDSWELAFFGNLDQFGGGDSDGDGVDNVTEFREGTNPASAASLRPRLSTSVVGGGRIVKEPELPSYAAGQTVRIFAVPDGSFAFSRWEGEGIASTANPLSLTLNANRSVTAVFVSGEIPLVASAPAIVGGGGFQAAFTGPSASALVIEASADLGSWSEIRRVEPFTGSYLFEVTELSGGGRFFRARLVP